MLGAGLIIGAMFAGAEGVNRTAQQRGVGIVEATQISQPLQRDPWSNHNADGMKTVSSIAEMIGVAFFQHDKGVVAEEEGLPRMRNLVEVERL